MWFSQHNMFSDLYNMIPLQYGNRFFSRNNVNVLFTNIHEMLLKKDFKRYQIANQMANKPAMLPLFS